jgi:hypothetical protein
MAELAQDKIFFNYYRSPEVAADFSAVTLAATHKALVPAASLPVLDAYYFIRTGKRLTIKLFGKITTAATPGNLTMALFFGTGADANGVNVVASAAQTLIASQTNISWMAEISVHCRSLGAAGTLFAVGRATFGTAVIAAGTFLIPASAAVASAAVDLTATGLILSPQALRSGSTAETMTVQDMEVIAQN